MFRTMSHGRFVRSRNMWKSRATRQSRKTRLRRFSPSPRQKTTRQTRISNCSARSTYFCSVESRLRSKRSPPRYIRLLSALSARMESCERQQVSPAQRLRRASLSHKSVCQIVRNALSRRADQSSPLVSAPMRLLEQRVCGDGPKRAALGTTGIKNWTLQTTPFTAALLPGAEVANARIATNTRSGCIYSNPKLSASIILRFAH